MLIVHHAGEGGWEITLAGPSCCLATEVGLRSLTDLQWNINTDPLQSTIQATISSILCVVLKPSFPLGRGTLIIELLQAERAPSGDALAMCMGSDTAPNPEVHGHSGDLPHPLP